MIERFALAPMLFATVMAPDAMALDCAITDSHISTVIQVQEGGLPVLGDTEYFRIGDGRYSEGEVRGLPQEVIALEVYGELVEDYLTSERRLIQSVRAPLPELSHSHFLTQYPDGDYGQPDLVPGDVVVMADASPCMPPMKAVFDSRGDFRFIITVEPYSDYETRWGRLQVDATYPEACGDSHCEPQVSFNWGGESFSLKAGESYRPKRAGIASISVMEADISPYFYTGDSQGFDWFLGHFVALLITFQGAVEP